MKVSFSSHAISAGHKVTLEAAETVLTNGGNAFDACVAAAFTMFITEPCMCSAGAGGFAMCLPAGSPPLMLDFFVQTPILKKLECKVDFKAVDVNFGNEMETFHVGLGSVAVPGIIHGMYNMHASYGSIPIPELLQIPMQYAKSGVAINTFQQIDLELLEPIFRIDSSARSTFFRNNQLIKEGDKLKMEHLPSFLQLLIDEGTRGFYKGEASAIIDRDSRKRGGYIRREDMENYSSRWLQPIYLDIKNHRLYTPNAPSLGGGIILLALYYLKKYRNQWLPTYQEMLSSYSTSLDIQKGLLEHFHYLSEITRAYTLQNNQGNKGTSHFNIVDKWGNAVATTISIGEGSGYFIPGTDMHMNNMMGEDFLLPNGFHSWHPNTRMQSMMSPSIITDKDNNFIFAGGSGGARRIPFMIAQVIDALYSENRSLLEAVLFPRIVVNTHTIHIENGFHQKLPTEGIDIKTWNEQSMFFGGVHAIQAHRKTLEAVGDPRRYGVGKVFS